MYNVLIWICIITHGYEKISKESEVKIQELKEDLKKVNELSDEPPLLISETIVKLKTLTELFEKYSN